MAPHAARRTTIALLSLCALQLLTPCLCALRAPALLPAVLRLGEVEWLHPAFHNEKFIFPFGYAAERLSSARPAALLAVPRKLRWSLLC